MTTERYITERPLTGRRLGRHVRHDPLSRRFPATLAPTIVSVDHAAVGLPLTQTVGSCTAEALIGALNSAPNNAAGKVYTQADAMTLYGVETKIEGQPYPPNDPGGDGLTVCKAAVQLGLITSYTHTFSLNDALLALVIRSVITGVNWYDSMDAPDANGVVTITPNAGIRGGHEFVADQIFAARKLVGFWNSWGPSYGLGGRFYMTFATWERLLSEQGDVTVPVP